MKILRRLHDPFRVDHLTLEVALRPSDAIPAPGDMTSIDDVGLVSILQVRRVDSPASALEPGDQAYALEVRIHQGAGDVPDVPGRD
jgi:hypothetical protein